MELAQLASIWTLFTLLAISSGCASSKSVSGRLEHSAIPFQHVDIGLCEDYPKETRSLEAARRDLEFLQTNHIHVLRIAFAWDSIETEPGKYDWSFWDDFVRMATDEYGIRLIPYVCYTPQWASTGSATNFWRYPPKDNALFARFVKIIVQRYHGRIHSWELWNEPDNHEYWEGSVGQFSELLKAGSRAVREADPRATVVLGGIAWNLEFLRALLEWHQVGPAIDVVNLHSYYETWSDDPMEAIGDHVLRASRLIQQYGNHQPIWLAEIGYSDYRQDSYVSPSYHARFTYEHTPGYQAETLGRALSSALATGRVQLVAWYRIHDLPPKTRVIGDVNNLFLGVLDVDGHPKPVLYALTFFHALFGGGFRCLDSMALETRIIQSDTEVHVFEKRDGGDFVTAWLRTITLLPDGTTGQDRRRETLDVILPKDRCNRASVYDDIGNRVGTTRLQEWRHGREELTIHLHGGQFKVYQCSP